MIYSIRYAQPNAVNRSRMETHSFIKSAPSLEEVKILADDHLRFLKMQTSDPLNIIEIVEVG